MKKNYFFKIPSLAVLAFFLFSFPASAQTPASDLRLTTSPVPINLKTAPGASVLASLKIKNDGLNPEKIKISLMKFKADSQTGTPILMEREAGDDYFDWVKFSENQFTLPSNEWKTITAEFQIPSSASFGYYYAVVFSRAEEQVSRESRQTILAGGTATLILLEAEVPGAKKEVRIVEFSADKKMYEFLPATFTVKLRNTGNVHIAPRGNIFLFRQDNEVAALEVNLNKGSILPDSPRSFQEQWTDGFPVYLNQTKNNQITLDEKGQPIKKLKWDFKDAAKLRFGKYTAKLMMVYDDGQRDVPIEGEVSFWVVPWRILIVLLVNFLIVAGFFFLLWHFFRQREKNYQSKK